MSATFSANVLISLVQFRFFEGRDLGEKVAHREEVYICCLSILAHKRDCFTGKHNKNIQKKAHEKTQKIRI